MGEGLRWNKVVFEEKEMSREEKETNGSRKLLKGVGAGMSRRKILSMNWNRVHLESEESVIIPGCMKNGGQRFLHFPSGPLTTVPKAGKMWGPASTLFHLQAVHSV